MSRQAGQMSRDDRTAGIRASPRRSMDRQSICSSDLRKVVARGGILSSRRSMDRQSICSSDLRKLVARGVQKNTNQIAERWRNMYNKPLSAGKYLGQDLGRCTHPGKVLH